VRIMNRDPLVGVSSMASVAQLTSSYSFDDFLVLVKEDQKADLLDGVIYMTSPESTEENKLGVWLCNLLGQFVQEKDLGEVFFSRVAFRITQKRGPEPDIAWVAKRRLKRVRRGFVDGPPDLAIEIVSRESVERDYVVKRAIYEQAGVREYWIVDPKQRQAIFLRRYRGKYRQIKIDANFFESSVLPGFKLNVKWLWAKRRPSVYRLIRDLLAD